MLTIREVSEKLSISERWLQKLCSDDKIPGAKKYGRDYLIPTKSLPLIPIEGKGRGRPKKT